MAVKTTAINKYNAAVTRQSGRVGNVRYVQKNGETYVRSAANSVVNNPRTNAQMKQRMKFASLTSLYSYLADHLSGSFQTKARNQSDYNAFVAANQGLGIYRSKEETALGKTIALPVVISAGKFKAVNMSWAGNVAKSSISVGGVFSIDESTTIAQLSAALVENNTDMNYGDRLSICKVVQDGESVSVYWDQIELSKNNTALVTASTSFVSKDNFLGVDMDEDGVCGIIHSNADGKMSKSTMCATTGQQAAIDALLTEEVFAVCAASYGKAETRYLTNNGTSTSGAATETVTLTLSVNDDSMGSITPAAGAHTYTKGSTVTLSASPESGHSLSQWSDGNKDNPRTLTLTEDMTLEAQFQVGIAGGEV